jgi:plastocyanin
MRKLTVLLALAATVAAVFAVQALAATKSVKWKTGTKTTVRIAKGGSVKWVWSDGSPHNVKGPGFTSHVLSGRGKSYTHKFSKKGTFTIICQIHPTTMKTVVKVG